VWGQLRPADHSVVQTAFIEYDPTGASAFTPIRTVQTASPQGFILAHLPLTEPGLLRIAWIDPATGEVFHSRIVDVR
jgi:hypothetical protein